MLFCYTECAVLLPMVCCSVTLSAFLLHWVCCFPACVFIVYAIPLSFIVVKLLLFILALCLEVYKYFVIIFVKLF